MSKASKILINVVVFLVVATFIWYMVSSVNKEETTYAEPVYDTNEPFSSPLKLITTFNVSGEIEHFDLQNDRLFIASGKSIYSYSKQGEMIHSFQVKENVRDIEAEGTHIYVLYPALIEVYTTEGTMVHSWEACSELSDYCAFTIAGGHVFVTDAENKNICKYTLEGNFVTFIKSPRGFIIPSYSFDIDSWNDTLYCANSGRHLVESYTIEGKFIAAFGGQGSEAGAFAGCCNPVYIAFSPQGNLITSEKGNPRISRFGRNGKFQEVLLNSKLLGGGNKAHQMKTDDENILFVAGKHNISVFQYINEPENN